MAGKRNNGRGKLPEQQAADRARQLLADIWQRRASVSERGTGYDVHLDGDLCARIRAALDAGEREP